MCVVRKRPPRPPESPPLGPEHQTMDRKNRIEQLEKHSFLQFNLQSSPFVHSTDPQLSVQHVQSRSTHTHTRTTRTSSQRVLDRVICQLAPVCLSFSLSLQFLSFFSPSLPVHPLFVFILVCCCSCRLVVSLAFIVILSSSLCLLCILGPVLCIFL